MTEFGEYLRTLRRRRKMSLIELAKGAGSSNSYLSQLETGKRNPPKSNMMKKIAFALAEDDAEGNRIYINLMIHAGYVTGHSERVIG